MFAHEGSMRRVDPDEARSDQPSSLLRWRGAAAAWSRAQKKSDARLLVEATTGGGSCAAR